MTMPDGEVTRPARPKAQRKRLRAVVDLWYPTDPDIIARLLAGENLRWGERGVRRVRAGEFCDDLPIGSRAVQIAKGRVEEVTVDEA